MSIRNLNYLFQPKSIAVIGASIHPNKIGWVVTKNLLSAEFTGPIMPVNPKYTSVAGVLCYSEISKLPLCPELAVICTPAQTVPQIIQELERKGTKAAIVLTAGVSDVFGKLDKVESKEFTEEVAKYNIRILGPNCLGLIAPRSGLNASFSHIPALPGSIAFISQSGALCTAVLDWAYERSIGFSHLVSLGDCADVDFADMLDYLSGDPNTNSILLYIEAITDARKFMSAARAVARHKIVIVVKSGRVEEGARAAASHTGALAGKDEVYDAAIERCGMLRVFSIEELFDAVETLSKMQPDQVIEEDLTILTNGGGPGVIATDSLIKSGGLLTELAEPTIQKLDALLPATWSKSNPIDIIGDADGQRYEKALELLLEAKEVNSVLILHVPTAVSSRDNTAKKVCRIAKASKKNVLTSWLGEATAESARKLFSAEGLPSYDTPESAVAGFLHIVRYQKNQVALREVPPSILEDFEPDFDLVKNVIQNVLAEGRESLTEIEAKQVISAYGIPTVKTDYVATPEEAYRLAEEIRGPYVLKIASTEISHKSDVGGVALDLNTSLEVKNRAVEMLSHISALNPSVNISGFTLQQMIRRPDAYELIIGVTIDPTFGPVLLFGHGGIATEVINDKALGIPPLNFNLARDLVSRTRVYQLLRGFRNRQPVNFEEIYKTLIGLSQLATDFPQIQELDINPLLCDEDGVLALDARIRVCSNEESQLSISPYPRELEEKAVLSSGVKVILRPIRPEDEHEHFSFFSRLSDDDVRFRFFGLIRSFPHQEMVRYTQIDYDREMAFIAQEELGSSKTLGVVRAIFVGLSGDVEFAMIVASHLKGLGLGPLLLKKLIKYCKSRNAKRIIGQVQTSNKDMLKLATNLGFSSKAVGDGMLEIVLKLKD